MPSSGYLPDPEMEPMFLASPRFFALVPRGKAKCPKATCLGALLVGPVLYQPQDLQYFPPPLKYLELDAKEQG